MTPTLVAHLKFYEPDWEYAHHERPAYMHWLENSFKKCVVRVNQREFDRISATKIALSTVGIAVLPYAK